MFPDFAIAGAFMIVATSYRRETRIHEAWIALGLVVGTCLALPAMSAGTGFMTHTLDGYLLRADDLIGLNTVPLAKDVWSIPWLWDISKYVYAALPLAVALGWIIDRDWKLIKAVVAGAIVAPVLYLMFPAVGPAHAFSGWPFAAIHQKATMMVVLDSSLPRNAFPSMHFAWALMLFVYAQKRFWRVGSLIYLFLMAVATMGSGEHYAVDLIGSVFLVWGIDKFLEAHSGRGNGKLA